MKSSTKKLSRHEKIVLGRVPFAEIVKRVILVFYYGVIADLFASRFISSTEHFEKSI